MADMIKSETLARRLFEAQQRLSVEFGLKPTEAGLEEWEEVPERNKSLIIAVASTLQPLFTSVVHGCCENAQRYSAMLDKAWSIISDAQRTIKDDNLAWHKAALSFRGEYYKEMKGGD